MGSTSTRLIARPKTARFGWWNNIYSVLKIQHSRCLGQGGRSRPFFSVNPGASAFPVACLRGERAIRINNHPEDRRFPAACFRELQYSNLEF